MMVAIINKSETWWNKHWPICTFCLFMLFEIRSVGHGHIKHAKYIIIAALVVIFELIIYMLLCCEFF